MSTRTILLIIFLFAGLVGCGPSTQQSPFAEWIDADALDREIVESDAMHAQAEREAINVPAQADAEVFVRLALERNPAIRSAQQRVRRLANRIPQVTSLDDPMLQVTPVGEMAETAAGQVDMMASVSQRLPLPDKLDARGRVAGQDVAEAVQQLEEVRLNVVADTRLAWWSYYYAIRAIEVTERNHLFVAQFKDVADAKFRAGAAAQEDVLRASVELHNLDNELIALHQRRTSAQAMLNRLIDRPADAPVPEPKPQSIEEIMLEFDALVADAAQAHPAIQRIRERIEGFRQRYELARLSRWPDLNVSASYNLVNDGGLSPVANGDDQWWIGFGINLPIWNERLDAAEREAIRGRLESIAALDDELNRREFRIQDALSKVESHQQQAILFRDVIVPEADQTVDASLSSYRAGKVEFLTLIDNWRKLLIFELTYHEHLAHLERSFADLQRAVGHDLSRAPAQSMTTESESQR